MGAHLGTTKLAKWGNSLGVRIPKTAALDRELAEGDVLDVFVDDDGGLVLRKQHVYTLDALIEGMEEQSETNWGPAQGNEAW